MACGERPGLLACLLATTETKPMIPAPPPPPPRPIHPSNHPSSLPASRSNNGMETPLLQPAASRGNAAPKSVASVLGSPLPSLPFPLPSRAPLPSALQKVKPLVGSRDVAPLRRCFPRKTQK